MAEDLDISATNDSSTTDFLIEDTNVPIANDEYNDDSSDEEVR